MVRRRTVFATPFVVVIGCSQPAPQPTATPRTNVDDARPEAADAATEAPVATAHQVPDEPPIDPTPTNCVSRPGGRTCNPPPVPSVKPKILDGRVVNVNRSEGGILFIVSVNNSDDVTTRFTGVFVDEHGPMKGTEFEIKNNLKHHVECMLPGRNSLPSQHVRLYEPGAPR